jgi:hypothetical protein
VDLGISLLNSIELPSVAAAKRKGDERKGKRERERK